MIAWKRKKTDTIATKRVSLLPSRWRQWGGLFLEFDINLTFLFLTKKAALNREALPSQLEVKMILCGNFSFSPGSPAERGHGGQARPKVSDCISKWFAL